MQDGEIKIYTKLPELQLGLDVPVISTRDKWAS